MMLRLVFLTFLLAFSISNGIAQQAWTFYNTTNSPLPENSVRCIASDSNGLKWIGTDYGLASYDGNNWTVYNTFNSGLPDNSIRSLLIDGNSIWVGTFMGGLARFDGTTWSIYNTTNSFIPDDFVRSLARDVSGSIWVGTIGGLGLFDGTTWSIFNMSNSPLLSNNISALWSDTSGTIVGTINGGVGFYSNGNWQHFTIWNSNLPDNSCLGITRDTSGTPWFSTPANGLTAYIGGIQFLTFSTATSSIASNSTTCIAYSALNDEVFIGSVNVGLIRKSGLNFISYGTANGSLPDDLVQCVHVDNQGIVWAGMQTGGVVRLDPSLLTSYHLPSDESTLSAYPNPATEFVQVELASKDIEAIRVYNTLGLLMQTPMHAIGDSPIRLDIGGLPNGAYRIWVRSRAGICSSTSFLKSR